ATGVILAREVGLGYAGDTARALRHVLAGHLDVHAAGIGAFCPVDVEEALHLGDDIGKGPRLVAIGGGSPVPLHWAPTPHPPPPPRGARPWRRRARAWAVAFPSGGRPTARGAGADPPRSLG